MGAVQAGFIIYFPWSWSRAVLKGPLSLYIYYTYQLMIQLLAPHASDQTFGAVATPSQSPRLIRRTDCSLVPHRRISLTRILRSLSLRSSRPRGHLSFRFSTSWSSSKVAYAFRLLVPIVSLSPRSFPILSISSYSPTFSPLAALEPSVLRPDYHLTPFSDRRPTPLRFVAQAHCQHINVS